MWLAVLALVHLSILSVELLEAFLVHRKHGLNIFVPQFLLSELSELMLDLLVVRHEDLFDEDKESTLHRHLLVVFVRAIGCAVIEPSSLPVHVARRVKELGHSQAELDELVSAETAHWDDHPVDDVLGVVADDLAQNGIEISLHVVAI